MNETKKYITSLLEKNNLPVTEKKTCLFDEFITEEENVQGVKIIQEIQNRIMEKWKIMARVNDILNTQIIIPNATVNKPYEAQIDLAKIGMNDIVLTKFENLQMFGLEYDNSSETIKGTPIKSGDFKIYFQFRIEGESESSELHIKAISLIINADPKSLWKNIPSTQTPENYWKPDATEDFEPLGSKHIVASSKRGRSHANVGSFRDDDYAFKYFENTGWSVVCVSDGAGSAALSRQGAKLACQSVIDFFATNFTPESLLDFDAVLLRHHNNVSDETSKEISRFVYNHLSKAAFKAHTTLEAFANKSEHLLKDFHSTLIFALYKKYDFGYAVLSFGVGDCPIGLINKELTEIKLMNWLDVGEFGGGTRFITMPEIFNSDKFATRFGFKLVADFSYLMLMTDGIYDPKFIVEANLEKIEKWQEFLADLGGNNEEKAAVTFAPDNIEIARQLSAWMDFWSPGNHDDRTLAIIF